MRRPVIDAGDVLDRLQTLAAENERLRMALLRTQAAELENEQLRHQLVSDIRAEEEIDRLETEVERLMAEIEHEKAQSKIVLDSYADENQRFHDENERLRAALKRVLLTSAIDQAPACRDAIKAALADQGKG